MDQAHIFSTMGLKNGPNEAAPSWLDQVNVLSKAQTSFTDPATDLLAPAPRHPYQDNMSQVVDKWDLLERRYIAERRGHSEPVFATRSVMQFLGAIAIHDLLISQQIFRQKINEQER